MILLVSLTCTAFFVLEADLFAAGIVVQVSLSQDVTQNLDNRGHLLNQWENEVLCTKIIS